MKLDEALEDPGEGKVRRSGTREVIPVHCTGNPDFRLKDVGGNPLHQEGPGGYSTIGFIGR